MPRPTREDRALARENVKKLQQARNAEAFKANKDFTEHDADAAKKLRADRAKKSKAVPADPNAVADRAVVPEPSQPKPAAGAKKK